MQERALRSVHTRTRSPGMHCLQEHVNITLLPGQCRWGAHILEPQSLQLDPGDENAYLATCWQGTPHGIHTQLVASVFGATSSAACTRLWYNIPPSA